MGTWFETGTFPNYPQKIELDIIMSTVETAAG